ncbi:MAG: ABC transporter ATP-binding protein [Deltaproteobacteria bacterium HGW-Deltaproteobacteria-6]|jgi:putative ABC transport system ATP-binding protein|nr:MAG: ABC transporter ATP-binding protein [Deltaproteobacteria bacterium HGW-Deltaproteobacteria-6]
MITLTNIHKKFNAGTQNEVYALRGIDLTIREGEFVTIIGTNGSGKSTLLNVLSGTISPDMGSVFINDRDVTKQKDYQRAHTISRVFQNPFMGTAPDMTIAENLLIASLRGRKHLLRMGLTAPRLASFRTHVARLEMQLEDRLDNIIGSLSGGQRQAVSLLMAVILRPDVLLLDEHTAALDPKSAAQIIALTKAFVERENLTTFMVTHSMQQALELGSRTLMMHKGRIIDDISEKEKNQITVDNLLDKFAQLRKTEKLTDEMIEQLRRDYL